MSMRPIQGGDQWLVIRTLAIRFGSGPSCPYRTVTDLSASEFREPGDHVTADDLAAAETAQDTHCRGWFSGQPHRRVQGRLSLSGNDSA
jgi:hypothetical protein